MLHSNLEFSVRRFSFFQPGAGSSTFTKHDFSSCSLLDIIAVSVSWHDATCVQYIWELLSSIKLKVLVTVPFYTLFTRRVNFAFL